MLWYKALYIYKAVEVATSCFTWVIIDLKILTNLQLPAVHKLQILQQAPQNFWAYFTSNASIGGALNLNCF